jgi:hypothetical protein
MVFPEIFPGEHGVFPVCNDSIMKNGGALPVRCIKIRE